LTTAVTKNSVLTLV